MSYTGVIIPIVDSAVDNSGAEVWMVLWRVWTSVENGQSAGDSADSARQTLWRTAERRSPSYLPVRRASGMRRGYRQRVVMRKPANMMPKPMRMFHDPRDGTGSVVFEM